MYLRSSTYVLLEYFLLLTMSLILGFNTVASQTSTPTTAQEKCPDKHVGKKVICYMQSWAIYIKGKGKFLSENIDPTLCTHLVYIYAQLNEITFLIQFSDYEAEVLSNNVKRFTDIKRMNPDLKVLIGLGGWVESSSSKYSTLISDPAKRSAFNSHVKEFLNEHNFDGLDLNWQFPGFPQGNKNPNGSESDRTNFALWLSELKAVLGCKLLTSAVTPYPTIAQGAYAPSIYEHLDWVGVLSFDYHGYWFDNTGYAAPLYSEANTGKQSCNVSIHFYLQHGCPPEKLILGIPTFGRTWTLNDPKSHGIGAPASTSGSRGLFTNVTGYLAYYEFVDQNWTVVHNESFGPYGYRGNQWVSFDDPDMVKRKAMYVKEMKLGGVLFSYIDGDTFQPPKNEQFGPYNLIRTAKDVLIPLNKTARSTVANRTTAMNDGKTSGSNLAWILLSILAILSIVGIIVGLVIYRRNMNKLKSQLRELTKVEIDDFKYGNPNVDPNDVNAPIQAAPFDKKYELTENQLVVQFDKILGSGQFGLVMRGTVGYGNGNENSSEYANELLQVAVKTVIKEVDVLYFKALLSELKIMAYLDKHDNIASLIGARTDKIASREVFIAIEFCAKGDLLHFLQKNQVNFRNLFRSNTTSDDERKLNGADSIPLLPLGYENAPGGSSASGSNGISTMNLIEWARQISSGMNYLSIKKVIHGDLAARNVLITAENVAKISDFGLSRQLLHYSNYTKTTSSPLPWRWMAIESLKSMNFSIQSDVWSYGVTLWEIFTLGDIPFLGLNWDHEFVDKLSQGTLKLHMPQYANSKIYELMLNCWRKEPENRISFESLSSELNQILLSLCESQNLNEEYIRLL